MSSVFVHRLQMLTKAYNQLIVKSNNIKEPGNGVFSRYEHPVLTAAHIPLEWRYDFNEQSNPYFMERIMMNTVFNSGAIKWNGKYILIARIEGADRKSFFAIAESPNGVDNFVFRKKPLYIPQLESPDTNVYDMRLTLHEDGWIYGLFCTERRDGTVPEADQSSAIAQCGIVRTRNLENWERLPDLKTLSAQQRNVVLHPEFVSGKYGFYTRPQDGFIEAGKGGGIAFGLASSMEFAEVMEETIVHPKMYHTVYEAKNGQGPTPIKTREGWLHLAHGVRNTAAGLRYVLYLFVTDLNDLTKVLYCPAGYLLSPVDEERVGDVSNILFCNGWIADDDGTVYIYYASSDTRMHVATTTLNHLLDYAKNTAPDGFNSASSVEKIIGLIKKNESSKAVRVENNGI